MTAAAMKAADSRAVAAALGLKVAGLLHASVVQERRLMPVVSVYCDPKVSDFLLA